MRPFHYSSLSILPSALIATLAVAQVRPTFPPPPPVKPSLKWAPAPSLMAPKGFQTTPDSAGFIRRWTILEPIHCAAVAQNDVLAAVHTPYFDGQSTVVPRDGDSVLVAGSKLIWHSVETKKYSLNLYHFGRAYGKPTSQVLFWAITIVNCPENVDNVRLAVGSNAGSVWWVNGEEVAGIYGDHQTVIDDTVSKRIRLKKGPNIVRAAIVNGSGATDFCARFLDKDDLPLKGYTVSLAIDAR